MFRYDHKAVKILFEDRTNGSWSRAYYNDESRDRPLPSRHSSYIQCPADTLVTIHMPSEPVHECLSFLWTQGVFFWFVGKIFLIFFEHSWISGKLKENSC